MEEVKILVIGAGIVGLAIGERLSKEFDDVVVVEKESSFGKHTSSRNSEVIHSGIYYPKDSLKAKLCVEGAELLYAFAEKNSIKYNKCGKLIVATTTEELSTLETLRSKGIENGVKDIKFLTQSEVNTIEPRVKATGALFVPSTGIVDTHSVMKQLESNIEDNDGFVIYDSEVIDIDYRDSFYYVTFSNGEQFKSEFIINSSGLYSHEVGGLIGIDKENMNRLYWCKGEYYKDNSIKDMKHLVYPVPDPNGIFLGIHLTINLNGEVRFGPNAYYVDELNYAIDESYKNDFYTAVSRYIDIDKEKLHLDDCGIRPKLQGPNDCVKDFYIADQAEVGFPGFIHLTGIESPGLTSCLAIANEVFELVSKRN